MINLIVNLGDSGLGFILGWLCWTAFFPDGKTRKLTFKSIITFIGVAVGSAILSLFPANSSAFGIYLTGLTIGFFVQPASKGYIGHRAVQKQERQKDWENEYRRIVAHWPEIDRIITQRLYRKIRRGEKKAKLSIDELVELMYSDDGKFYIMQLYAQRHVESGIELKQVEHEDEEGYPQTEIYLEIIVS